MVNDIALYSFLALPCKKLCPTSADWIKMVPAVAAGATVVYRQKWNYRHLNY